MKQVRYSDAGGPGGALSPLLLPRRRNDFLPTSAELQSREVDHPACPLSATIKWERDSRTSRRQRH